MATFQDCSIGVTGSTSGESAYKTYTAVSRWYEFSDESLDWNKNIKQGKGLRVSSRVPRSGRRQVPTAAGGGDITLEILNKGLGLLWQAAFGSATSTQEGATAAYQQTYVLGDSPVSLSIQKGLVETGQGSPDAYTFLGCMVDSFEINVQSDDIPTAKFSIDAGDLNTSAGSGTAYASPTMPSSATNFSGAQVTAYLGGTLTAPVAATPTKGSLASTTAANVRSFSLQVQNNLATDRYNFGASGRKSKPVVGLRSITGKISIEYDGTTWAQDLINETSFPIIIDVVGAALAARNEGFQIILPAVRIDTPLPMANQGGLITVDHSFTVLDNLSATQPIWLVVSTPDTAL